MRTADMIKSKFYRGRDLEGRPPITLTIAEVTEEIMGRSASAHGVPDTKAILWFREGLKGISLNKGKVALLEYAFGPESDLWVGKKIRLSYDPSIMFGDKAVGGVKLETPPGVKYDPSHAPAGWGAPQTPQGPPGAPPPPVWNPHTNTWDVVNPPAQPRTPPPPVWNPQTNSWDVVNPQTGEVSAPVGPQGSAAAQPTAQPQYQGPPPTISQRVNAPKSADPWADPNYQPLSKPGEDFDDDIPFDQAPTGQPDDPSSRRW